VNLATLQPHHVVDMHVHLIANDRDAGSYISPTLRRSVTYQFLVRSLGLGSVSDEDLAKVYLDQIQSWATATGGSDRYVLLGMDWVYDADGVVDEARSHLVVNNDAVFDACDGCDRFLAGPSINPQRADAIEALEDVAGRGAALIKVLPNMQGFDPADPAYLPFWTRIRELGLPILAHTGYEHALPSLNEDFGDPRRWSNALDAGCTVIGAHCAAAGKFHREEYFNAFTGMLSRYPRLYGDVSGFASPIRSSYLKPMLSSALRRRRLLVGSDFPIPCLPGPFVRQLGVRTVAQLRLDKNPLRRNRLLFESLGLGDEIMTRAAKVLLGVDTAPQPRPRRRSRSTAN
jgi:uncharacterized protein